MCIHDALHETNIRLIQYMRKPILYIMLISATAFKCNFKSNIIHALHTTTEMKEFAPTNYLIFD